MKKLSNILIGILFACIMASSFAIPYAPSRTAKQPDPEDLFRFGLAFSQIKQFYVKDKADKELFSHAIRGMLAGLDPHSLYLDEETLEYFRTHTEGEFTGIGVEITMENNTVKVVAPIDDSPAYKAGVRAGDYIIAANGKPLVDMDVNKIVRQLRGKPGSEITLTVINREDGKPRELKIIREKIAFNSVKKVRLLSDGFGYIRISHFQEKTGKKLKAAVKKLQKEAHGKLKGIVLDLRNNPGGLLDSAIEVTDAFLDSNRLKKNKKIVYTKGRIKEAQLTYNATPGDLLKGAPIVVLINQGSASGSEIVAGALQDYRRAVVLGKTSFGKGSVQTLLPLDDKTGVKLTTALYYTPKGRSIQATGIRPDVLVEDLKIEKPKEEALFFSNIREKHLSKHLKNANEKTLAKNSKKKRIDLVSEDYQLAQAVGVLKALALVKPVGQVKDV